MPDVEPFAVADHLFSVIALDISPTRLAIARHNAALYGVADRIEFILADFLSFARALAQLQTIGRTSDSNQDAAAAETKPLQRKIDVVFLSPPWGGPSYISDGLTTPLESSKNADGPPEAPEYSLASIRPVHGAELFKLTRRITKNVAYFLPRNVKLEEVSALLTEESARHEGGTEHGGEEAEMVEVEEEWMGTKLKALTCYFGGLVSGQEHLFQS